MNKALLSFICTVLIIIAVLNTGCNDTNKSGIGPNHSTTYWELSFQNIFFNSIAIDINGDVYVVGGKSMNGIDEWVIKKFDDLGIEDTTNWNKTISSGNTSGYGFAQAVAIDIYGNVYVAGNGNNLLSITSGIDWWIKKFDSNGIEDVVKWDKKFDGNGGPDLIYSLTTDGNGNVYVAGKGYELVSNASGSESGYDWWVKKFDGNGVEDTINWNKKIDGNMGWDSANSIIVDSDNSVFIAGNLNEPYPNVPGGDYWWIKKFSKDGIEDIVNWNKKVFANYYGEAKSMVLDKQGGIYVAGYGNNLVSNVSYNDWWIKYFNENGIEDTVNWDKKIDNNNTYGVVQYTQNNKNDRLESAVIDRDGNLYAVGYGTTNINNSLSWFTEGWIKKYNSIGVEDTTNWDKKISILQDNTYYSSSVKAITVDVDANVYIIGTKSGTCFIKKYNSSGGDK